MSYNRWKNCCSCCPHSSVIIYYIPGFTSYAQHLCMNCQNPHLGPSSQTTVRHLMCYNLKSKRYRMTM